VVLGTGAGEIVTSVAPLAEHALVIVPQAFGLSTAEVYAEADRLGLPRGADELESLHRRLLTALGAGEARLAPELLVNDLERAAVSLRPEIAHALQRALAAGADHALVCGSGPTVAGLFWGQDGLARAQAAAAELSGACVVSPVTGSQAFSLVPPVGHNSDDP
jgi:4-diphosphocytidyl-2-C-methyl-D-erythritol kinase